MRIAIRGTPDDWFAWLLGPDEELRHDAKLILGGLRPDDAVPLEPLVARLSDPNEELVIWAVIGLSGLEHCAAAALPALIHGAVAHPAFGVRQAALAAVARIGPEEPSAKQAMLYALGDESPWARSAALQALIEVRSLDAYDLAAIQALEHDSDPLVRHQVAITLRNIRLRAPSAV